MPGSITFNKFAKLRVVDKPSTVTNGLGGQTTPSFYGHFGVSCVILIIDKELKYVSAKNLSIISLGEKNLHFLW